MSELRITDERLKPIADKVLPGERLSFDDGLALYRSPDLLAIRWLADSVREKRYGDTCFFNINRHLNPTHVCLAHCQLCTLRRHPNTPRAYTLALAESY